MSSPCATATADALCPVPLAAVPLHSHFLSISLYECALISSAACSRAARSSASRAALRALAPIGPAGAEAAAAAVAATLAAVAAAAAEGKGWPLPPSEPRRCAEDGLGDTAVSRFALASRAALLMLD